MPERIIAPQQLGDDSEGDVSLRPASLSEFIGQEKLKESLSVFLKAAQQRHESIEKGARPFRRHGAYPQEHWLECLATRRRIQGLAQPGDS